MENKTDQSCLKLTAMQAELLKRIRRCFPLLADLSRTCVALYVPGRDTEEILLTVQEMPHTVYVPQGEDDGQGLELSLVQQALRTGRESRGEWGYAFPVLDSERCIAVVLLRTREKHLETDYRGKLLSLAAILLQQARKQLEKEQYRHISAGDGVIVADRNDRILAANPAALRIYHGLGVDSLTGRYVFDRQLLRYIRQETVDPERPWEKEVSIGSLQLLMRDIPLTEGGTLRCRIMILSDVTELRQKEQELQMQRVTIREIHHRVKNNLQTVASLLRLQARRSSSQEAKQALQESIGRILTIASVHELLSYQSREYIPVREIADKLLTAARDMLGSGFALSIRSEGTDSILPAGCINSIALILNELITNSVEHAFEGRSEGNVSLLVQEKGGNCILELSDDGIGLPEDFSIEKTRSLGLQIVQSLVENDLEGSMELENREGTLVRIIFPLKDIQETQEREVMG